MDENVKVPRWYLVHTYSGKEQKVIEELKNRIRGYGLEDKILEILLPSDYYSFIDKKGKRKIKPVKVFPGYIFVKMILTDESWYVVRNTPGVLGFVGPTGKPTPISEEEIEKIVKERVTEERAKEKLHFDVNDRVKILVGPFKDMEGVVEAIDESKGIARVVLKMFGREMPVELKSEHIQKV